MPCEKVNARLHGATHHSQFISFSKEKKNLQNLTGVYLFNVGDREPLDRSTASYLKEFSRIEEKFLKEIGSCYCISAVSKENTIYNSLWVAQALLRKGSLKTSNKRILLFTNEDDPFGDVSGLVQRDMIKTTVQRAKDAQDLGISIEILPMSRPDEKFDVSKFYAGMLGLDDKEISHFESSAVERLEDMREQLRKKMFTKRKVKTFLFSISDEISIEMNSYALIRPTVPGGVTWLDSVTNLPLKPERSFICEDTGALLQEPAKRFFKYKGEKIVFSIDELSEIKRHAPSRLRLLGFKPLHCLKDYHNLRPSTFIFPSDEEILGSTRTFVALHRSMLRLGRFAVAFCGSSARPQLVALIAQEEISNSCGQVEPPGMHMIYLPYSDDIRYPEEHYLNDDMISLWATDDQISKASALLKRIDLKSFSVCQFSNPSLQRHYSVLQAIALDEDEIPEVKDETLPDEEGLSRPGIVKTLDDFKVAVYGKDHDKEEDSLAAQKDSRASKRKAIADVASQQSASYDWADLADNGKLKDLTVVELKYYLTANNLPLTGKKDALISRILSHLQK
ncbi:ATP-dependent DNA helicase 2 subunit Ku70-like protein isoform X2 [Wolffia australiana]